MNYLLLISLFISLTHSFELQSNQVCNNTFVICYPTPNEIWYHYNHYTFIINQNYTLFNISVYDLHLETILLENDTEKSMKSWFNLTRPFFQVQVTDDWFPTSLAPGTLNKTWQFNVSIVPHHLEELDDSFPTQFNVIQTTPKPLVTSREHLAHKWILLIIIIVSLLVMIAIGIIVWLWKNMQKMKKTNKRVDHTMQSSILSTPDAILIADTFRQVLSTSDINKSRTDIANHLLEKQLKTDGTSVLEVERRTSSLYKPKGWTSRKATDFVQNEIMFSLTHEHVKRRDKIKIGHGGTLDPMAEGVLVLGVGKSCKQLPDYLSGTKEYLVQAKLGEATDTFDAMGKITSTAKTCHITQELLLKTLPLFEGNITQVPPIYSALKIQGKRLYDYARQDIVLPEPIKARSVYIEQLKLTNFNQDVIEIKVICGGGTYMRSLVHDLAIAMGTFGHMTALKRTRQGPFHVQHALQLDDTFSVKNIKGE